MLLEKSGASRRMPGAELFWWDPSCSETDGESVKTLEERIPWAGCSCEASKRGVHCLCAKKSQDLKQVLLFAMGRGERTQCLPLYLFSLEFG